MKRLKIKRVQNGPALITVPANLREVRHLCLKGLRYEAKLVDRLPVETIDLGRGEAACHVCGTAWRRAR